MLWDVLRQPGGRRASGGGDDELVAQDWFADHTGRLAHQDEVEDAIADWVAKTPWIDFLAKNPAERSKLG